MSSPVLVSTETLFGDLRNPDGSSVQGRGLDRRHDRHGPDAVVAGHKGCRFASNHVAEMLLLFSIGIHRRERQGASIEFMNPITARLVGPKRQVRQAEAPVASGIEMGDGVMVREAPRILA